MQVPALLSRVLPEDLLSSPPVLSLIAANIVTIALAILGSWDVATVMFIYWAQSIIIGFFTVLTILLAEVPPEKPEDRPPGQKPGEPRTIYIRNPWAAKGLFAGFFALHYGFFHWGYYTFIVESGMFGTVNFADPGLWLSCGLFFANHLYSFFVYRRRGTGSRDIMDIFFRPYRRIIPMHLTVIFGGILLLILEFLGIRSTLPVLVLFLVLKTASDVAAHVDKHALPETPQDPATGR